MNQCIACQSPLTPHKMYDYQQCPKCHSYVYISDQDAQEENKAFFNDHFMILQRLKISKQKKKIYAKFLKIDMNVRKKAYLYFDLSQLYVNNLLNSGGKVLEVGFGEGHKLFNLLEHGVDAYGIDISEVAVNNFASRHVQFIVALSLSIWIIRWSF
jgi:predicted RNA-binding Zn-ribbon protein involved in translation (DUF1610 family)